MLLMHFALRAREATLPTVVSARIVWNLTRVERIAASREVNGSWLDGSPQDSRVAADRVHQGTLLFDMTPVIARHIFRRTMHKRISIDQLRIGMKVEKLDRSWLATPFLRNKFTITSAQQIEQLSASGVQQLDVEFEIEIEETVQVVGSCQPPLVASDAVPQPATSPIIKSEPSPTTFSEELHVAKQVYSAAKGVIQQAMEDVRMGDALNMEAVQHVVESMADSILRNPDALTSLSRLKLFDEYTFYHSVNTSLLAISLGRDLGYDRTQLLQLGTGMLLHDIGKTQIPLDLLNKPGRFEAHEFELMKQHVMRGADLLSATTGLSDEFLRPTLEHHERVNGTGYPCQHCRADLSEFGLIAAVVDIYDAVTSDRCYHKGKSPHETLQLLYQLGSQGHVDSIMVQRFVQIVGVYPVGSCVAFNTGEAAIVTQVNHHSPLKPHVLIVTDRTGIRRTRPLGLDLAAQSGQLDRVIKATLDPSTMGIDPHSYLDTRAA